MPISFGSTELNSVAGGSGALSISFSADTADSGVFGIDGGGTCCDGTVSAIVGAPDSKLISLISLDTEPSLRFEISSCVISGDTVTTGSIISVVSISDTGELLPVSLFLRFEMKKATSSKSRK